MRSDLTFSSNINTSADCRQLALSKQTWGWRTLHSACLFDFREQRVYLSGFGCILLMQALTAKRLVCHSEGLERS